MRGAWTVAAVLSQVVLLQALPARADYNSGVAAYQKRDFQAALKEFAALAELGHARSQFNLASMHLRGEGTPESTPLAYAWMSVAAANASAQAIEQMTKWGDIANDEEKAAAARLLAEFGPDAMAAKLLPRSRCELPVAALPAGARKPPRRIQIDPPKYPDLASDKGLIGWVMTAMYVAPDGRPRDVQVIEALPRGEFENAVIRSLMHAQFAPASEDGKPVGDWVRFAVHFRPGTEEQVRGALKEYLRSLRKQVSAGDPAAQYLTGVLKIFPGVPGMQDEKGGNELINLAAHAGLVEAQYYLGVFLTPICVAGQDTGRWWVHQAATGGLSIAQQWLAGGLMRDSRERENRFDVALFWLERAATAKTPSVMRILADALISSPKPDYARALAVAEELARDHAYDPAAHILRAQAHAALGQFPKAVSAQTEAIERATAIGWELQPLERDLGEYRNGRIATATATGPALESRPSN